MNSGPFIPKERPFDEREFYMSAGLIDLRISKQVEEKNLRNTVHIDARLNSYYSTSTSQAHISQLDLLTFQ